MVGRVGHAAAARMAYLAGRCGALDVAAAIAETLPGRAHPDRSGGGPRWLSAMRSLASMIVWGWRPGDPAGCDQSARGHRPS